jgi:excisionase family DNA binding protein
MAKATRGRVGKRPTPPISEESATLTPLETRRITRFGVSRTYQLLRDGLMPSIKIGSRYFIPKSALLRWLDAAGGKIA